MIARLEEAGLVCSCNWTVAEGDVCSCLHHRQRHAPYAKDEVDVLRPPFACAECPCDSFIGIGSGGDSQLSNDDRRKYAQADLDGVLTADVFWLLAANDKGACGSWVELGAALSRREWNSLSACDCCPPGPSSPTIIVSGPKMGRTIFTELADLCCSTDEEALEHILASSH
jgi:hypothetical protein